MAKRRYTKRAPKKKKSLSIAIVRGCDHCGKSFPVICPGITDPETGDEMRYTYGRINWSGHVARSHGLEVLIPNDRRNSRPTDRMLFFCNKNCMEASA